MKWLKAYIQHNCVQAYSDKSVLLMIPSSYEYGGMMFWFPQKLAHEDGNKDIELVFTEDWKFRLFKKGNGKTNRNETVKEELISGDEFYGIFEENGHGIKEVLHIPEKVEPIQAVVPDELVDD